MQKIGFPALGLNFTVDPIAFSVFGYDIAWYALLIVTGILVAFLFVVREGKRIGVNPDHILDIVLIGTPVAIICARAYYVACKPLYYSTHKDEIIAIWNGGIAIYGAIIGAVLTAFIYCKARKLNVGKIFDVCSFGLLIGQMIGRWGNFVNGEAHGGETTLPWGMYLGSIDKIVHPTFLYESLWNLVGFVILFVYRKRKHFEGELFLWYIAWYGFGRTFIEGLRTDSLYIGATGLRTSQLLAVLTVIISCIVIAYKYVKLAGADASVCVADDSEAVDDNTSDCEN